MSSPSDLRLDRPSDGLLVRRTEHLAGSYRSASARFALTATCGGRPLRLQPCQAAPEVPGPDVRGFWVPLVLQDWLDVCGEGGRLRIEFAWEGRPVATEELIVSPIGAEVARAYPISDARYDVALPSSVREPTTLIFPGLGAVGGTSLCQVFRMEAHRRGWGVPVHHEADHDGTWVRYDFAGLPKVRWVDGHECFLAGKRLGGRWERVTLLREPRRRLVSLFNYNSLVHPQEFPYRTLASFLESGSARRYSQAEGLLRIAGVLRPDRLSDGELAEAAIEHLDRSYAFVGLTERFEESVFYLARLAGLDSVPLWTSTLAAPRREGLESVPERLAPALRQAVAADEVLYRVTRRAFDRTLGNVDFGASLRAYQRDAASQAPMSDVHKAMECLRWRQFLSETAVAVSGRSFQRGAAA